ncbi:MAG: DUF6314 family protein [Pseudomonadota bacterium]
METQGIPLDAFAGDWSLHRRILDAQGSATLEGRVTFHAAPTGLRYREQGVLTLPTGTRVEAERTYFWERGSDGVTVRFDDGRPFHHMHPGITTDVHHDCSPDRYSGRYDWTRWPQWRLVWDVSGPRKSYRSDSVYTRL